MTKKNENILINASNLHNGGGVQVATSFIFEFLSFNTHDLSVEIFISDEVAESLTRLGINTDTQPSIRIVNTYGLNALFSKINKKLSSFDLVFTIFGPNYFIHSNYIDVVGFAQPWILYDDAYSVLTVTNKIKSRLKFFAQKLAFKRADYFVVELEHVRDGLINKGIAKPASIRVAYNCISSLYLDEACWKDVNLPLPSKGFNIGFLGRNYPHKNTKILPEIKKVLARKHGLEVNFFVTFSDEEWDRTSDSFKYSISNVGSLAVTQCPRFYQAMDAIIFPSLLECFSATPLETMAMEKPLFSSDRRFIKDVCGNYAHYFDPFDPNNAASVIADYIANCYGKDTEQLAEAKEYALSFSSARHRAEQYLEIIRNALKK